jgi:hypothetical protein
MVEPHQACCDWRGIAPLATGVQGIHLSPCSQVSRCVGLHAFARHRCRIGRQRGTGFHQPFSTGPPPNHGMHDFHAPGSPDARVFSTQLPRWSADTSVSTIVSDSSNHALTMYGLAAAGHPYLVEAHKTPLRKRSNGREAVCSVFFGRPRRFGAMYGGGAIRNISTSWTLQG